MPGSWAAYKIKQTVDRIGIFVSIVSTRIPFKGTGKEYIGDDIPELADAVKHAIQQCLVQLRVKLARNAALRERQERKHLLVRYVPVVANALYGVLENLADGDAAAGGGAASSSPPSSADGRDASVRARLLQQVRAKQLTPHVLQQKLTAHIEHTDAEQAFQLVVESGVDAGSKHERLHIALWPPPDGDRPACLVLHAAAYDLTLLRAAESAGVSSRTAADTV